MHIFTLKNIMKTKLQNHIYFSIYKQIKFSNLNTEISIFIT